MDAIGLSEIAAGVGPAHGREKGASLTERLAHEVSILFGVGRHFGWQPGAGRTLSDSDPGPLRPSGAPHGTAHMARRVPENGHLASLMRIATWKG